MKIYFITLLVFCLPSLGCGNNNTHQHIEKAQTVQNTTTGAGLDQEDMLSENKMYLPSIYPDNTADSIVIVYGDELTDKFKFIIKDKITYLEDASKKYPRMEIKDDSIFNLASVLFVDKTIPIHLGTFLYDMGQRYERSRLEVFDVTIYRNGSISKQSVNTDQWHNFTRTFLSKHFKNFENRLSDYISQYNSLYNTDFRPIYHQSDSEIYPSDFQPMKIIIKYWEDMAVDKYFRIEISMEGVVVSYDTAKYHPKNKNKSWSWTQKLPLDNNNQDIWDMALELFFYKTKQIVSKSTLINKYNQQPKKLIAVTDEKETGDFAKIIDTHVEDQIIVYSPEFNEFMDRLRKLIEKAEKE